jgi:glycerophosphoryl diester phosphodiesterase
LDRTSDGTGLMAETTFDIVKNLDAGSWFAPAFAGESVPTLEEVIELCAELNLGFNMELKTDTGREIELATLAMPIAVSCWGDRKPLPLISSFSRRAVAAAKVAMPSWPRSFLFDRLPDDWQELAKFLDVVTLNGNQRHLTQEQVAGMRAAGYAVLSYTVNERARAETLFGWGVDGIFTDLPGEMLKAFPEK